MRGIRVELRRWYAWGYLTLNSLIAALLLFWVVWSSGGEVSGDRSVDIVKLSTMLLVWFALSYLAYRRVGFERWCSAHRRLRVGEWYQALSKAVDADYRPMVRLLHSADEVSLAARELITDKDKVPVFLNGKVVFLGAAANQSDRSRRESIVASEDSERTPAQVYQGAIEEAMSKLWPIYRIVSLLTPDEFVERSLVKRRQYISWIGNQIVQLRRNKNYIVLDNKRAPKWGASGAAILSSSGYLQFTSAGGQALFVRDAWLSRHVMSAVMADLSGAKKDNKTAYTQMEDEEKSLYLHEDQFGESRGADELGRHVGLLTRVASERDKAL